MMMVFDYEAQHCVLAFSVAKAKARLDRLVDWGLGEGSMLGKQLDGVYE